MKKCECGGEIVGNKVGDHTLYQCEKCHKYHDVDCPEIS